MYTKKRIGSRYLSRTPTDFRRRRIPVARGLRRPSCCLYKGLPGLHERANDICSSRPQEGSAATRPPRLRQGHHAAAGQDPYTSRPSSGDGDAEAAGGMSSRWPPASPLPSIFPHLHEAAAARRQHYPSTPTPRSKETPAAGRSTSAIQQMRDSRTTEPEECCSYAAPVHLLH